MSEKQAKPVILRFPGFPPVRGAGPSIGAIELHAFRADGTEVVCGDTITDFRGDDAIFARATRAPDEGRTGKILTGDGRELYMTVFSLTVREIRF